MIDTIIVVAKRPVAGRVKTRLVPELSSEHAAVVAAAALRDTLRTAGRVRARRRVLSFDGSPGRWLPIGWRFTRQPTGGLDRRLAAAFDAAPPAPTVLIGMDTPQLRPDQVEAFDPRRFDACLGLARDGGYWAIGLRNPRQARAAIETIPMSTPDTGRVQLDRLHALGLRVQLLDPLTDVDTFDDACSVGRLIPDSDFARALDRVHFDQLATVQ